MTKNVNIARVLSHSTAQWRGLSKKDFPEEVLWERHACTHQQATPVRVRWIPRQSWSVGAALERLRLPWEEWEDYVFQLATHYAVGRVRTPCISWRMAQPSATRPMTGVWRYSTANMNWRSRSLRMESVPCTAPARLS